jgi:ABC-type multidrug transport system fused ATPase/permease subunit
VSPTDQEIQAKEQQIQQEIEAAKEQQTRRAQLFDLFLSALVTGAPGGLIFAIASLNFIFFEHAWGENSAIRWVLLPIVGSIGIMLGLGAIFFSSRHRLEGLRTSEEEMQQYEQDLLEHLNDPPTLKQLWQLNRAQMNRYDVLTRHQAKDAYTKAQIAMAGGMLLLLAGAVSVVALRSQADQIAIAVLTGLGTALAGYVGKTYLETYRMTIRQLNYFYQEPLDESFLLGAERLARNRGVPQEEMLKQIVARILQRPFAPPPGDTRADQGDAETRQMRARETGMEEAPKAVAS